MVAKLIQVTIIWWRPSKVIELVTVNI